MSFLALAFGAAGGYLRRHVPSPRETVTMTAPAAPPDTGPAPVRFRRIRLAGAVGPLAAAHLALVALPFVEFTLWAPVLMLAVSRFVGLGVTAGFHRGLAHRSYRTSRWARFALAAAGCAALQNGPLWWVAHHRRHHARADRPGDPHSPLVGGLVHSHVGWLFRRESLAPDRRLVRDLAKFPELVWLDRLWVLPGALLAGACYACLGWTGVVYAYCLTVVLVAHVTFAVNSVAHTCGRRRFETGEASRNNATVAVLALGEGWHNNHHRAPSSACHGFAWYEYDETYVFLRLLARLGLVWDLKPHPRELLPDAAPAAGAAHSQ